MKENKKNSLSNDVPVFPEVFEHNHDLLSFVRIKQHGSWFLVLVRTPLHKDIHIIQVITQHSKQCVMAELHYVIDPNAYALNQTPLFYFDTCQLDKKEWFYLKFGLPYKYDKNDRRT